MNEDITFFSKRTETVLKWTKHCNSVTDYDCNIHSSFTTISRPWRALFFCLPSNFKSLWILVLKLFFYQNNICSLGKSRCSYSMHSFWERTLNKNYFMTKFHALSIVFFSWYDPNYQNVVPSLGKACIISTTYLMKQSLSGLNRGLSQGWEELGWARRHSAGENLGAIQSMEKISSCVTVTFSSSWEEPTFTEKAGV